MMSFTEEKMDSPVFFKKYDNGTLSLNIGDFDSTILVSRENLLNDDNAIKQIEDISTEHLDIVLATNPEIIIIGTGKTQQIPQIFILSYLASKSRTADFMNSNSACKTFNLLANENRRVCAIIIP